jgi:hypothetical protein
LVTNSSNARLSPRWALDQLLVNLTVTHAGMASLDKMTQ